MLSKVLEEKNDALFEELVPVEGCADTKAGELVRAVNRIGYRFWNDGDQIGVDYGNETCNAAARFIMEEYNGTEMKKTVSSMWGIFDEELYERGLETLVQQTIDYIEAHPELKTEANDYDMLDWKENSDEEWKDEEEDYDSVFDEPWAIYDPD